MSVVHATDQDFQETVLQGQGLILVDFWAEWCGPCKMLSPSLDAIAKAMDGKVTIVKVDIDKNPQIPSQYGVRSIPTLTLFKDGQAISTKVGVLAQPKIQEWLDSHL